MFSGLAWVGSRSPHPVFGGRGDRASCFLMPWPHGGIRDSIWLCHFSRLKYSWAAAPHSRVAASDWLGNPVVNDSCRVVSVMAAKRQKSSGNIIEFSLFIVAVCSWPNKEGTSWIQKKKNWIHFLQSLTDALPLPESGTSKTKLETHWLFQLWPILPGLYILSQRNCITILPLLLTPTIYGVLTRCQTPPPITLIWISPPNTLMK